MIIFIIFIVSNVIAENVQAIMLATMQALDSFLRAFLPLPSTLQLALAACQKIWNWCTSASA
jgi:hypothetical protein